MGEVKLMQVLADAYYDKPDEVNNKVCPYIHVWVGVWDDEPQSTSKYELLKDAVITARKLILQEGVTNHDGEIINGDKTIIVINEVTEVDFEKWKDNPYFQLYVYSHTVPHSHRLLETSHQLTDDEMKEVRRGLTSRGYQ